MSGLLSYAAANPQLLGEAPSNGEISVLETVSDGQTWSYNTAQNLISPTGDILGTDGYKVLALTPAFLQQGGGDSFALYECSVASYSSITDSSGTTTNYAFLQCTAQVSKGDGSSFVLCQDIAGVEFVETGAAGCKSFVAFTQFSLTS